MKQRSIPCVFMRGGTSRGPFFHASDLPSDRGELEQVLLRVMGSPDVRQIDGLGGATTVTSKVAIVSVSDDPEADIDYLFAQVDIENELVDWKPTCGNMLSGVGPFAIEEGLIPADIGSTEMVIRSVNIGSLIDAVVQTPDGFVEYDGQCTISGVPGQGAPIELRFREISGTQTNKLLPTGQARELIDGIEVSCVDVAVPIVIARAEAFGLTGYEPSIELNNNEDFIARMQRIRAEAGLRMGLGDVTTSVIPKFAIVASPEHNGHFASRYMTPWECHQSYAVSGSIAAGACAMLPGSVIADVIKLDDRPPSGLEIEHPSGSIKVALDVEVDGEHLTVKSGGSLRTARRIMDGRVYIPAEIWP